MLDTFRSYDTLKATVIGFVSGFIAGGIFGALKYVTNGGKLIENRLSGLEDAKAGFDKASLVLKNTDSFVGVFKGGSMVSRTIAQYSYQIAHRAVNSAQNAYNIVLYSYKAIYYGSRFALNNFYKNLIS
jgi:hypothetical protein